MSAHHEVIPRQRIGDISLDFDEGHVRGLGYREDTASYSNITGWHVLTKYDGLDCYVKDGRVVCVACYSSCHYQDQELLDRTPDEIIKLLGSPDEIGEAVWVDEDRQQIPYEYDALGFQLWFEEGKSVTIFINDIY